MAKDRQSKGENVRVKSHRNPNLLSHYHELSTRVFHNGERANEYLHNLFLKAAKNGEEERIRNFLARSSKNCNVNLNYKDKTTGNTAVVFAALKNHVNIVKMLLNYGADITLLNDNGQSIFDVAPNSIIPMLLASVERKGASNRHLLQAAWQGNLQMLRRLLNSSKAADLDVNCKNADGMTPLLLVTRDVNLFEKIEKTVAESGYSPLEVVKELLQHKADCSITTSDGKSPLHYIAHNKGAQAENMANMIIEDKISQLDLPDKSNSLPIHLATRYDNRPVLLALINGGADVNARGRLGQTPLHVAATHGHERCSSDLLSSGADVTIVDDQGYSPVDVSKNRKVKMVLKEAWVEQTRECSSNKLKCTYSAPTEHMTEKEKKFNENVPESVSSPRVQKETSPRKISAGENIPCTLPDVSRSNESQVPHPPKTKSKHVKRSHSMTKTLGYMMPRPPRTSPCDSSNRTKYRTQIRQISSFSANAGMRSCRHEMELPKLSITNIELQLSSCLRSDIPSQQSYCNRYSSIQRFRLLSNPSTLPLTPSTYLLESSSRMSDYSSSQGSGRVKLPKTLAPLSTPSNDERKPSEDTRQGCSRNSLYSGHELVGDVLDLDNLESHSSCHPSLAKIVFSSDREIVQPPPSPCEEDGLDLDYPFSPRRDNELEYEMINDKETASDNNDNTVRENRCHETVKNVKDENPITASIEQSNENKKEELSLIENKAVSSCDNWLTNDCCDDGDDCYKTKTFCTADRSKFWIPCTQNGETSLGNTSNAMETSNNVISNPSKENKYKEQENTSAANKNDDENVGTVIVDERNEKSKNSVSFYVDFGDFKTHNSINRTCKCGKIINNEKLNRCEKCTNRLPEKKTFWISLDGEASDGETEGVSGMKNVVERKGSSSEEGERFSRRAQSFPENKLPLIPKFSSKCNDFDLKSQEQTFQENYLIVSSEDKFIIQPKRLVDSRNEASEDFAKDDKEFQENSELKFYSEDTFVIKKNVQKSGGETETIAQDASERDQGLTGNEDDECIEGAGELHKDSKGDKGVVGGEHEVRSSIVLQSLSMDDDQQGHEQNDENGGTEITNPLCSEEKAKLQTEPKKNVETFKNDMTLFLKTAWSNDCPSVEQSPGVQICNAFPSPVPPVNLKPDVQPPIGNGLGKTKLRKTNSGKSKKKASAKESKKKDNKSSIGKEQAACCGKKGKKGKKGKGKKPKPMFKEISVNQSFGCMSYEGAASSVACELKEGMLSPDLDKVPTLSIDSRGTTKLLRMKFSSLSPIPESPRSAVSVTPRGGEEGDSGDKDAVDNLEPQENSPRKVELVQQEERQSEMIEDDKVVNRDREDHVGDCCTVSNGGEGGQAETPDEGVDEVDGGMLSRFFNMCMPRLKMESPESDSEALVNDDDDDVQDNDDDDDDDDDDVKSCQDECPVDEADPEMEDLIQDILENHDHNEKDTYKIALTEHEDVLSEHNQNFSEQDNTGSSQETSILSSDSTSSSNTCHPLGIKEKNEKKSLKENWTTNYVRQMTGFSPWEFDTTDDVFVQNENDDEVSVGTALNEEMMSDDSSYVSCESTSYAVSESSTTESNDSYFSSQESFHGMPSLSSHDDTTAGSVDINLHEQVHKPQTSATSSIGSSNDSRATLRPRSNSNSSETSVRSCFPSASKGFVRSQVSSASGSLSSTTSCGEELQWQKGSILGKGGFGTVYLGLVNTGEMIAVKQVELSNKDESEAEKQYEKLQEEVSLLKSLHHQNIVRYIGTCLDDNSVVNIFMELVPGGSIAQALKRFGGAFVEPVFQRYTKQILSGVDYMHKKNVIHRDIKGGNIMLMPNGVIKLIDFGCAKRLCMSLSLSKSSIMHSMKGTPYWMAPEVIKETSGQGTKSDIWSIGCTVYEMATGNPPWSQMEPFAAMFAIGNGTTVPQLSNSFSQAARDFTAACMNREPSARPSASELLHHVFITQLL